MISSHLVQRKLSQQIEWRHMSDTTTPINPGIGELFKEFRKKKINPMSGKSWTLQDLSTEVSGIIQQNYSDGSEEGLSASAISRLENGSLLPGKTKLKILADFLSIPDSTLKPLIDLGNSPLKIQATSHIREQSRMRELENKLQKSPLDWLQLLSAANIAGYYVNALEWAEDGLLVLESPTLPAAEQSILRALIQSKKAYAQYRLEQEQEHHLQRSLDWAKNADSALKNLKKCRLADWEQAYLRIETVRSLTTASMELFNTRFVINPKFAPEETVELQSAYEELHIIFEHFESALNLKDLKINSDQQQMLLELYLYFQREKDRLGFKWLEVMEMHAFWNANAYRLESKSPPRNLDEIALICYQGLLQRPKPTLSLLKKIYKNDHGQLFFTPAQDLQSYWEKLSQSMLNTLEQHDQLHNPDPNKAYQESVMLYPITAARLGQFDRFIDLAYFKLIYMQTNTQTRSVWYYIRSYCYALYYRLTENPEHLEISLQNWFNYCYGDKKAGECNLEHFSHCFGEVALWSTWFPLILDKTPASESVQWFQLNLKQIMEQPRYKRLREKMTQA